MSKHKWIVDAKDIAIDDKNIENLLLVTPPIKGFLDIERDNKFFIMATKGYGKTFLLRIKSLQYYQKSIRSLHEDLLVDKPGFDNIIFNKEMAQCFTSTSNWTILWNVAILMSMYKQQGLLKDGLFEEDRILKNLVNSQAVTITNYCRHILHMSRSDFYLLSVTLDRYLIPLISKVTSPISAFIDNIDEFLEKHINYSHEGPSTEGEIHEDVWYNAQIGLVEAIYHLSGMNNHIKVFASIRKEIFVKIKSFDTRYSQYVSNGIDLCYSKEQLKEIFLLNIKKEPENNLFPNTLLVDPIKAFLGISKRNHTTVITEQEDVFDFIYRHTLQRPRDLMIIGSAISEIPPDKRTPKLITHLVNEKASEIAAGYLNEIHPHLITSDIKDIFKDISSNILTKNEMKNICSKYNKNCADEGCESNVCTHVFCALFKAGLIGIIHHDIHRGGKFQKFLAPGEAWSSMTSRLPNSNYYLVHPSLYHMIMMENPTFNISKSNIIGHDRPWKEEIDQASYLTEIKKRHVHFGPGKLGLGLVVPLLYPSTQMIVIGRPSTDWEKTAHQNIIEVRLNTDENYLFEYYHDPSDQTLNSIIYSIDNGINIMIMSDKIEILRPIIEKADSISTALGGDLNSIVDILRQANFPKTINLYPFENNRTDVQQFKVGLQGHNENIKVVNTIADRMCTQRAIYPKNVIMTCESYFQLIVQGDNNGDVKKLFSTYPKNVIITDNENEYNFYYRRKFWLLNSIHMIMAIYGYAYLTKKNIPLDAWKGILLTIIRDADKDCDKAVDMFIRIQSLRLIIETPNEILKKVFGDKSTDEIYSILILYARQVVLRIDNMFDAINRVLDIDITKSDTIDKLKNKLKDRILEISGFINEKKIEISELNITQKPQIEEMREVMNQFHTKLTNVLLALAKAAVNKSSRKITGRRGASSRKKT